MSFMLAYFIGALNPAAFLGAVKKKNLREIGTGNLGATNVTLSLGKAYGVLVMAFDVTKAYICVKLAKLVFPHIAMAGLLAGLGAMVGHIFPVYMRFSGGKGLAAFAGMILAFDPTVFIILLAIGIFMIVLTDYPLALPISAAVLAPFVAGTVSGNSNAVIVLLIASSLLLYKHTDNIMKVKNGSEMKLSQFLSGQKQDQAQN